MKSGFDFRRTVVDLSSAAQRKDLRESFRIKAVAIPLCVATLYFARDFLPFPYPHLFLYTFCVLILNLAFYVWFLRTRDTSRVLGLVYYVDAALHPGGILLSGGFISPFIFLALLSVMGTPIIYTRSRVTARNIFVMILVSYILICLAQKTGFYQDPTPFSAALKDQDGLFYSVITIVVISLTLGFTINTTIHQNLHELVSRSARIIQNLIRGTSSEVGPRFYQTMVRVLAKTLECQGAFAARRLKNGKMQTVAVFLDGDIVENFEFYPWESGGLEPSNGTGDRFLRDPDCRIFSLNNARHENQGCLGILLDGALGEEKLAESIVGIFSDRTRVELERERDEEERISQEKALAESHRMEAIGRLASGVAHDFNNIMSAITGYAALLKLKHSSEHPEMTEKLDGILHASSRADELTRSLLTFARKTPFEMGSLDIHETIRSMAQMLQVSVGEDIEVVLNLNAQKSWIWADGTQIERALLNIGLNARDAMNGKGRFVIETHDVPLERDKGNNRHVVVSLRDTGIGMDEETRSMIFQPFFTTKARSESSGLGLAGVYGCIRAHDGHIEVSSELGQGTTFRIFLPVHEVQSVQKTHGQESRSKAGEALILVVDDEDSLREIVQEMLAASGFKVVTGRTGLEALEYYRENSDAVDLVLLDIRMPEMDGKECFLEMKKINPGVRAVVMTGYGSEDILQTMESNGLLGWIPKPIQHEALVQTVRKALVSPVTNIMV